MPAPRYSTAQIDRVVALREAGQSFREIAAATGVRASSAQWHCLRLGILAPGDADRAPPRRAGNVERRHGHVVRRFTEEEDARLLALEAEGLPVNEIARRLDRRRQSIIARLATLARHDAGQESGQ